MLLLTKRTKKKCSDEFPRSVEIMSANPSSVSVSASRSFNDFGGIPNANKSALFFSNGRFPNQIGRPSMHDLN